MGKIKQMETNEIEESKPDPTMKKLKKKKLKKVDSESQLEEDSSKIEDDSGSKPVDETRLKAKKKKSKKLKSLSHQDDNSEQSNEMNDTPLLKAKKKKNKNKNVDSSDSV